MGYKKCCHTDSFKQLRATAGLSQAETAELLGVSVPTIRSWEASKARAQESALRMFKVHLLLQGKADICLPGDE